MFPTLTCRAVGHSGGGWEERGGGEKEGDGVGCSVDARVPVAGPGGSGGECGAKRARALPSHVRGKGVLLAAVKPTATSGCPPRPPHLLKNSSLFPATAHRTL